MGTLYVVTREHGDYDSGITDLDAAFPTEALAKEHAEKRSADDGDAWYEVKEVVVLDALPRYFTVHQFTAWNVTRLKRKPKLRHETFSAWSLHEMPIEPPEFSGSYGAMTMSGEDERATEAALWEHINKVRVERGKEAFV